jgi:hypothetical protein
MVADSPVTSDVGNGGAIELKLYIRVLHTSSINALELLRYIWDKNVSCSDK